MFARSASLPRTRPRTSFEAPSPAAPIGPRIAESGGPISARVLRWILFALGMFGAGSAIGGGIGLLTPGALGIPMTNLEGTPFATWLIPALLLIVLVGGTEALAVVAALRRAPLALCWFAVAGFALIIWILVQVVMIPGFVVLHAVYFGLGIAQLVLVLALLHVVPGVVSRDRWNTV